MVSENETVTHYCLNCRRQTEGNAEKLLSGTLCLADRHSLNQCTTHYKDAAYSTSKPTPELQYTDTGEYGTSLTGVIVHIISSVLNSVQMMTVGRVHTYLTCNMRV